MAVEIEVHGAHELAARMRAAGDGQIRRDAVAAIRRAVHGIEPKVKDSLGSGLPRSGGLAAAMSRTTLRTQVHGDAVTVTPAGPYNAGAIDAGVVAHPLFGNRGHWFTQAVTPGLVTGPILADADRIRDAVRDAVSQVTSKV